MSLAPLSNRTSDLECFPVEINPAHLIELGLTPRECEVMRWISEGKRDREIASILGLSRRTVEKHAAHIFEKLNVETRTAAANQCRYSCARKDASVSNRGSANPRRRNKSSTGAREKTYVHFSDRVSFNSIRTTPKEEK